MYSSNDSGFYGVTLSNLMYTFAGLLFIVVGVRRLGLKLLFSRWPWFIIGVSYNVPFASYVWHYCYAAIYCFAWQGTFAPTDDVTQQAPMDFDMFNVLYISPASLTLFIPDPTWFMAGMVVAYSLVTTFIEAIPGFMDSVGPAVWIAIIMIAELIITWSYVWKTRWYVAIWALQLATAGVAVYFKMTQSLTNYYFNHFLWHMMTGLSVIIRVIGWWLLLRNGELRIYVPIRWDYVDLQPPKRLDDAVASSSVRKPLLYPTQKRTDVL